MIKIQLHHKTNLLYDYLIECGKKRVGEAIRTALVMHQQKQQLDSFSHNPLLTRTKHILTNAMHNTTISRKIKTILSLRITKYYH